MDFNCRISAVFGTRNGQITCKYDSIYDYKIDSDLEIITEAGECIITSILIIDINGSVNTLKKNDAVKFKIHSNDERFINQRSITIINNDDTDYKVIVRYSNDKKLMHRISLSSIRMVVDMFFTQALTDYEVDDLLAQYRKNVCT
jgi:hypothetical protein